MSNFKNFKNLFQKNFQELTKDASHLLKFILKVFLLVLMNYSENAENMIVLVADNLFVILETW